MPSHGCSSADRETLFYAFLLQLMLVPPILIVPNMTTLVSLHLYDTLAGVDGALLRFGVRRVPDAADVSAPFRANTRRPPLVDGASRLQIIWHVLLPLARPGLAAFAIVSVTAHWNEFLWPLMATSSPSNQVLTVGLASFTSGAEAGSEWGVVAAGTFLVAAPLLVLFVLFQRQFVASFTLLRASNRGSHRCVLLTAVALARDWRRRCAAAGLTPRPNSTCSSRCRCRASWRWRCSG